MNAYESLQQLEDDLEFARNNPGDDAFFDKMLERYRNATNQIQVVLKAALFDKMLEHNPAYIIEKIAEENPNKIVYCRSTQDPFFYV